MGSFLDSNFSLDDVVTQSPGKEQRTKSPNKRARQKGQDLLTRQP